MPIIPFDKRDLLSLSEFLFWAQELSSQGQSQRAGATHKDVLAPLEGRSGNYEPPLWRLQS